MQDLVVSESAGLGRDGWRLSESRLGSRPETDPWSQLVVGLPFV